jgi:arabinoxylan arabinofuranohydrolase
LVAQGSVPAAARDPAILQEGDGTTYLVFGCWDYYIARLNVDMVSLAEKPRKIELDQKMGPYGPGKTDDKPFLHKCNGKYYLSWGCFYAMSDNIYGPYTYKGCIITQERTAPEFQKALVFDRHGSFFEFHGQWYFACNDQSWPGKTKFLRDSIISYVHYRDNGEIEPIYINRIGVGQYDASEPRIEAEDYFNAEGVTQGECPDGGFELRSIRDGSWVEYPNVTNLPINALISFRVAALGVQGGTVEVHENSTNGPLLGAFHVRGAKGNSTYETISTHLNNRAARENLYLVFHGGAREIFRLNWLDFPKP